MRGVGRGLQWVWGGPPVWPEPPPAEPMPAAERKARPTSQRQETHREKTVSLKMLACGYRLDADSPKVPRRSIIEVPASCPAKPAKCLTNARRKRARRIGAGHLNRTPEAVPIVPARVGFPLQQAWAR